MEIKERFSLLLLDPSEIYFEDFSVDFFNENQRVRKTDAIIGSLKICSKSLVFEPQSIKLPLIKLRYSDCSLSTNIAPFEELSENDRNNYLVIRATQSIEMLKGNVIEPYEIIRKEQTFKFKFHYANIDDILSFCQQLHRASTLSASDQRDMIATIAFSCHSRKKFNPLWLENIFEKVILDCKVDEIRPLVVNPGRLLLTSSFIYFQPFNNIFCYPVIKIQLSEITAIIKKRFLLRHIGLEIKWAKDKNLYVSFKNSIERKKFFGLAEEQSQLHLPHIKQESMILKWQNRVISNYDYLLYLNSLADRSFEDLTQYPVFPWILSDYRSTSIDINDEKVYRDLSKPVGALNSDRLAKLKERALEMDEPKYLYGSHYSNPGFVLFYLVRKVPHLMLCLQNGKFDCADRMFNKILDTYNNCLSNMSDFKELIPEFYDIKNAGDFLQNTKNINYGHRSDGSLVGDVILPPWADNSPQKFIKTLREALESEYVSANLHHWIDLIFGYKQRGKEAVKANNIFHPNCYEGSVDLDSIKDMAERHALEVQIYEFGQIPKQLFTTAHVSRNTSNVYGPLSPTADDYASHQIKDYKLELKGSYSAHKDEITSICIDDNKIWSTGKDGILKCFSILEKRQTRSILISSLALSSCVKMPKSNIIAVGSWDNTISLYDITFGKVCNETKAHFDAVSCLTLDNDLCLLITGSWDCTVKLWRGENLDSIGCYSFEDNIVSLNHRKQDDIIQIAIGTEIGDIYLWDITVADVENYYISTKPRQYLKHPGEIKCLQYNKSFTKLASCSSSCLVMVNDIETGMELFSTRVVNTPKWLCWYGDLDILLCVDNGGEIYVWNLITGELKCKSTISNGSLSFISYSKENNIVITSGQDGNEFRIKYWSIT